MWVETQTNVKSIICSDFNAKTSCTFEQYANEQDRVSPRRRDARPLSCLPDMEVRVSSALYRKKNRNEPVISTKYRFLSSSEPSVKRGKLSVLPRVYLIGGKSRDLDASVGLVIHAPTSGGCSGEICAARPQRRLFWD